MIVSAHRKEPEASDQARGGIRVRGLEAADWRDIHSIWTHPDVVWGTLQLPYRSAEENRKKLENPPDGMARLVAEIDGRVVGCASLQPLGSPRMRHAARCGLMVHPGFWNRGVGSALVESMLDLADNWLNLRRIELTVYTDNAAAVHLYQKYGFVIEGTNHEYAFRGGEYVDVYTMARLRPRSSPEDR
jgi:putative acetyltransferase